MEFKKWTVSDSTDYSNISKKYNLSPLCAKAVCARLSTISESELFSEDFYLNSPWDLKDMDRAVDRINEAIDMGQKIIVYGDYDADGVTATVILTSYLEAMGADVNFYIPSRDEEGYGLNTSALKMLSDHGCELVITVDNGISAVNEIEYAKSLGMDVVVTDHHKPQAVLPDCIVVDPHRADCKSKFKDICGAFVAFKLVAALDGGEYDGAFEQFAELVTIATLADVVPLVSENRSIVKLGLERIKNTDNLGLRALMDAAFSENYDINATSVAFGIAPRINAAGRMGDACRAAKLLLTENEQDAYELCDEICRENDKRKNTEQSILEDIERIFEAKAEIPSQRVIVVSNPGWHHGVLGIVASRIVEKFGKPAIVLSQDGKAATGSGRSVEGFSLFDAVSYCSDIFTKFGGHSLAVGVSLDSDKIELFRAKINEYAKQNYTYMPVKTLTADAVISPDEITLAAIKELSVLEPTGKDNPAPVFVLENVLLEKTASIGNGKHTRLSLKSENKYFNAVLFGTPEGSLSPLLGRRVDLMVSLGVNIYGGNESVNMRVFDIRPCGINDNLFFKEKQLFELCENSEPLTVKQAKYLMPTRDEAKEVFKILRLSPLNKASADLIWYKLLGKINRAKIEVILSALCQSGIADFSGGEYGLVDTQDKKDLFACNILKHISGYLSV